MLRLCSLLFLLLSSLAAFGAGADGVGYGRGDDGCHTFATFADTLVCGPLSEIAAIPPAALSALERATDHRSDADRTGSRAPASGRERPTRLAETHVTAIPSQLPGGAVSRLEHVPYLPTAPPPRADDDPTGS